MEILRDWEQRTADLAVYESLDILFPAFQFRRVQPGGPKDHWASRFKCDLSLPKHRVAEKTVVYRSDMRFREQGEWNDSVGVMDRYMSDRGLSSIYEAYSAVSAELGLDMPRPDSREVVRMVSQAERRRALADILTGYFMWNLENNTSAKAGKVRSYLRNVRGFSREDCVRFRFGFVPDWSRVVRHVTLDKGFSLEELDSFCGVRNAEGKTSVGRSHVLAVPYDCAGETKGFLFRRVEEGDGPKYIASSGLDRVSVFFNMPADRDPKGIVVVEGEFDALKATSSGILNVVAIGGSDLSGDRRRQVEDAFRRGVNEIILCPDLDADGEGRPNFSKRHAALMRSIHTIKDVDMSFEEIYVAAFDVPCDPDEFIRERGGEAFAQLLRGALPYWDYIYRYNKSEL
jgi:DNA primase (bacterial type)